MVTFAGGAASARRILTLPHGVGFGFVFSIRAQLRFDSRKIRRARVRAYRLQGYAPEAQVAPLLHYLNRHVARLQRRVGGAPAWRYLGHRAVRVPA